MRILCLILLAAAFTPKDVNGFVVPSSFVSFGNEIQKRSFPSVFPPSQARNKQSSSSLSLFPASMAVQAATQSPAIHKAAIALLSSLVVFLLRDRLLWPGYSRRDPSMSAPLPVGTRGCPLLGHPTIIIGDKKNGPFSWYAKAGLRFKDSRVFRFFFMGSPAVCVSGGNNIAEVASKEFKEDGVEATAAINVEYAGSSLVIEKDGKKHQSLRKLVGQALTPKAVQKALPTLYEISDSQVEKMLQEKEVIAVEACTDLTLDFAWKQLLGLKLSSQAEIDEFVEKVNLWNNGMGDLRVLTGMGFKRSPGYKAFLWLRKKIEDQIDALLQNGPDNKSTLSGMVFATDDEDPSQPKLSREEIVNNSIALILAGSETSASTLANAFLCIGKRPQTWQTIREEQDRLSAKYGDDEASLLKALISEKEAPYLDGVIKEALRIKPIVSGAPRKARASFEIDGYQVPKGFLISPNILVTHTLDPTTYKDDLSHMDVSKGFQPERWLNETTKPTTDFLPFGAGPHYCLGYLLAMAEMKMFLAVAARKMDFALSGSAARDPVEWQAKFTFIPKQLDGVPMLVTARA